ncbi:hypothetical protein C8F04DRAFT_1199695 [Mycena alexandri]|uniref:Uncharacterized protein n=1 Tax=Mycena alexandri TaxID=1745969 RepID=A0AAD6RZV9_9AGAR|nr:hypothetical protein C8F04DRAFT_1199695 [Mycena alexandri]
MEYTSWMLLLVLLGYKDTLQVIYHILVMKNGTIWLYKKIALYPYYALLYNVRNPKTYPWALDTVYVLERSLENFNFPQKAVARVGRYMRDIKDPGKFALTCTDTRDSATSSLKL